MNVDAKPTIIDLGVSNVGSVVAALRLLGLSPKITTSPTDVETAAAIILPGVGAFADGMASLRDAHLVVPIQAAARKGIPILGLCLGMQLLATESEEHGLHEGLDLIPGRVTRMIAGAHEKVPNIGWCDVSLKRPSRLFSATRDGESFYFVHSYHFVCKDSKDISAYLHFGAAEITAAVERKNLFGVQFHPEKSQDAGLSVLSAFAETIVR